MIIIGLTTSISTNDNAKEVSVLINYMLATLKRLKKNIFIAIVICQVNDITCQCFKW